MYLLFDLGGTKTRMAFAQDANGFEEPEVYKTPKDYDEMIGLFMETAQKVAKGREIKSCAGGVRALGKDKNHILHHPNIPLWGGKALKDDLEEKLGAQVFLENDTAMVGLGEVHAGAGKNAEIVVYITISTGVGGVRIVDGEIDESAMGFEPGHQIMDIDGSICPECDPPVTFEKLVSGSAIEKRMGKPAYEIKDEHFWKELAWFVAYGLNDIILHWSPNLIVLGGSMMKEPGIDVEQVKKDLHEVVTIFPQLPDLVKAELDDLGGLHGALNYAQQKVAKS